jgi:D-3-phosphoglycerate dehydrogenase
MAAAPIPPTARHTVRILLADTFPDAHRERLEQMGHTVTYRPDLTGDTLPADLDGHEILVVRSTRVTAEAVTATQTLTLIIRAGAGTNTIDIAAAADRGIFVCNTPGRNAIAVAELTMGLLTAIDRSIPDNVRDLRAGAWNKARYGKARGLAGRSIGIVGVGRIGLAVADRAKAFAMDIVVVERPDRRPEVQSRLDGLGVRYVADLAQLAETCDVLTFHVPGDESTEHLVSRELLAHVRPGAVIINTSRGSVLDEVALIEAMDAKGIRAGLDVFADEPQTGEAEFDSAIARHPNVYGTHHIGASTDQAQEAIADAVLEIIDAFEDGSVLNCVNLLPTGYGMSSLTIRHHNRVGVLARVLGILREADLNVEHMENSVFVGGRAASVVMRVGGDIEKEVVWAIEALGDVIAVSIGDH